MSRSSEDPLKHVVSFRVTESEKSALEELARIYGVKASDLLRKSLNLLEMNAGSF